MNLIKKIIAAILAIVFVASPLVSFAAPAGFEGGVHNEYRYQEVVFITGEPRVFSGELKITENSRSGTDRITYKFTLTDKDALEKTKLTRTVTFETVYTDKNDKGQTIARTSLTRFSERIEIGSDRFELEDYQFSKSDVIDNRPASDFYSGNFEAKKTYSINRDEGEVIITISGGNVGYENFWGSTETQTINYYITSKRRVTDEDGETQVVSWEGTVKAEVSDSMTKRLVYSENEASLSSFYGGYVRTTNREIVSRYEYDLPRMRDNIPDKKQRIKDNIKLAESMVPKVERLPVPKFRDVMGHWAEEYIAKLYSLDVFDESQNFFAPEAPMTREEFIKGVIRACDIRTSMVDESKNKSTKRRRNEPPEESPFKDVSVNDENYQYIKQGLEKNIITGVSKDLFMPKASLTRAEAVTILMRALGFVSKAPNPGYYTWFSDDDKIPSWARDSVYVAREVGIIQGDSYNRFNPDKVMTRAEASAMLVRFLEFLEKDLQRDYRENIILFN
ncbi:S-layer homology domain-containing protein [Tepidanaerobacter sp. GT38]|nr:S-layer homology domain-containing protein [Tepidanaerobacter sp. GT38]MCG1011367.1 S-layer homology domain-containing protein [Tepidanaerobacter sp. GT38]